MSEHGNIRPNYRMPSTAAAATASSGSGRRNGTTSVAINGKTVEEKGSDVTNASERVTGVEMRCVSATMASDFLTNIAHLVVAMRWTRQLSSEATSTSSRRCSKTSHRQSTRGWSERPSGGESGNSAKAGPETKSQRWQHLVSTKDNSSIISRKPIEIDFRVSPSLCSVEHDSGVHISNVHLPQA